MAGFSIATMVMADKNMLFIYLTPLPQAFFLTHPPIRLCLSAMREEILGRGRSPLPYLFPLPFNKMIREGGQGDRLLNNLLYAIIFPQVGI
jgi:hypothetical protein